MEQYFRDVLGIAQVRKYTDTEVNGIFFKVMFDPYNGEFRKGVEKGVTDVFVYYSGHGAPSKDGASVYLLPFDIPKYGIDQMGYELDQLFQDLLDMEARSVTVFLDACFSGASRQTQTYAAENLVAMKAVVLAPQQVKPWLKYPNFTIFTSSDFNETSLGYDDARHGLFTYYLMAGLGGKANIDNDFQITMKELKDYVTAKVVDHSTKTLGIQTPQFSGNETMIATEYIKPK